MRGFMIAVGAFMLLTLLAIPLTYYAEKALTP